MLKGIHLLYGCILIAWPAFADTIDTHAVDKLVASAKERTHHPVIYNGAYQKIAYPNGDVADNIGVCTDVIIRAYRGIGIDLQRLVHEDMKAHFSEYPSKRIWGLAKPDSNIDHRRVPNLQRFFERHGKVLANTQNSADYQAGDIVTWMLPGNLPHIGIVIDLRNDQATVPLVVHNIGRGPKIDDSLFAYKITGHYRYFPE